MSKKTFYGLLGFVIILAIAYVITSFAFGGVWNPFDWKKSKSAADDTSEDGISIATYALTANDYAVYGISEQAIDAGVLTANYKPSNTTNKRTGWTWRFAGNAWSQGKVLSDYVVFTAGANYAPECSYEVLKPFGDTIIVEATSRANSSLKATTNIDYLARFDCIWHASSGDLSLNSVLNVFEGLESDKCYSIEPTSYSANITITLSQNLWTWIQDNIDDKPQRVWSCEDRPALGNATGAISWSDWFDYDSGNFVAESLAAYYDDTGSTHFGQISVEITCYYNGEAIYTFTDIEDIDFTVESIEAVSVYPTEISPNVEYVVI